MLIHDNWQYYFNGLLIAQSEILFYTSTFLNFSVFLKCSVKRETMPEKYLGQLRTARLNRRLQTNRQHRAVFTIALLRVLSKMILLKKRILAILLSNLVVWFFSYFFTERMQHLKKYQFKHYQSALFYILEFGLPLVLHYASFFS